jgi:hypothetical protein
MRPSYLFLFTALPALAQTPVFTFGVTGGVPAQTPLSQTDSRMPFVVGPTVDIRLLPRITVETGFLFDRLGRQSFTGTYLYPENSVTTTYGNQSGHGIEVPVLAKVHLFPEHRAWRPFLTLGPTVRRTSFDSHYSSTIFSGTSLTSVSIQPGFDFGRSDWHLDPVLGAGIDFKAGRFHLDPQLRYSYWGSGTTLPVRKNQVDILLGLRF